ncbi:MAG: Ig-like domain-containing protein [Spirochaetota bacterium]
MFQPFDIVFGSANSAVDVGLASATPLSPTRVRVKFNKPVSLASAETSANYTITAANGTRIDVIAVTRDPFDSSVIYLDTSLHTAGSTYTLQAANLVGVDGATLSSSASRGTYTAPNNVDATAPTINAASMSSTSKLNITFSEAVDLTTAQTSGNYTFYTNSTCTTSTTFTISNLSRDTLNFAKVSMDLNTPNPTGGTTYYVRANAVKDIWGNVMSNVCSPAWVGFGGAVAPKVSSAISVSPSSVLVTFDSAMTVNAALTTAGNYTFSQCSGANLTMGTATSLNSTQVVLTSLGNTGVTAGTCKLTVTTTGITGTNGATLSSTNNVASFPYNPAPDVTSPSVGGISAVNATTVRVSFNEPIQDPSASNFTFSPSLTVGTITCNTSKTSCDITTGTQTTQTYTATISGIRDTAGNTMTSASTTFTGDGKPYIVGIIPIDQNTVRVQWSEPVSASGNQLQDYLVNGATVDAVNVYPSGATMSDSYDLTINTAMTAGTSYTLTYADAGVATADANGNNPVSPMTLPNSGSFVGPTISNAPIISSVTAVNPTTVRVTFDQALDNSSLAAGDFSISVLSGSCPSATPVSVSQVQAGVIQLVVTANTGNGTCRMTVGAGNVTNLYGVVNASTMGDFTYTGSATSDTTQPTVLSVVSLSSTEIRLFFSEPVSASDTTSAGSARNLANYTFSPALSLTGAAITCTSNDTICTLTLGSGVSQTSTQYSLAIANIQDKATPTANTMASQTLSFYGTGGSATAPTVYLATLINSTTVEVTFTELMDLTTSQTVGSYSVTGSGTITVSSAVRQADATKVRLTISPGAFGSSTTYTVTVTNAVTDLAGNALGTPASATFSGSSTAPSTAPDLAASSDTGSSNTDNITGNGITFPSPGLVFTGTVAPNTTVVLYDGGVIVGSVTSDSSGNYSITASSTPNPGQYTVATVSSTGTVSDTSPVITITFDNTASAAPGTPVLVAGSNTGISNSDTITNATTPQFTVTCVVGESVQLYNGSSATGTAQSCTSSPVTLTAGTLAAGSYSNIRARQTDTAGNESPASAAPATTFTIDTTAPAHVSDALTNNTTSGYVDVTISEAVYGSATAANPLGGSAFTLNFASNGGGTTAAAITSLTTTTNAALAGGETTIRVNFSLTGTPTGVETISVTTATNAVYDSAGNAASFSSDTKTLSNASIASISAASYAAPALPAGTGSTTGYVDITFSQAAYGTSAGVGAVASADFQNPVVVANGGTATSVASFCVATVASTSCPGTAPAAGATQVRLILTFNAVPSGSETVQINAASNEIYSASGGITLSSATTGALSVIDRRAPVISSVSPASSTTITNGQVSYTLGETCASGSIVWTSTSGTGHPTSDTSTLSGSELTSGTKTNITLSDPPTLVSNTVYTVAFNCTDAAGNAATAVSSTSVTYDVTGPSVSSVSSSTADGTYGTGASISIQVVFNEAVTVNTTGGTPQLTLGMSPSAKTISYVSGSGSTTLNFTYTVAAGESTSDLEVNNASALSANGGTLRDAAGNNATLTLPVGGGTSLGGSKAIVIDGVAPTVTNITSSLADGTYKAGQVVPIQVTFSEAVKITGTPQITLTTTDPSTTRAIDYTSGDGTATLTFNYTVQAGDTTADLNYASTGALSGTITDNFTNNPNSATLTLPGLTATGSLGTNKAIVIDTTAPTVTNVTATNANATYGTGAVISVQITFSETVTVNTGGGTPVLALNTSPAKNASYVSGSGTSTLVFEYTVASGDTSSDLNYSATNSLTTGGGTIRDAALNDAALTLPGTAAAGALGVNKEIVINAAVSFSITTAETLDCDPVDGIIDHYRITFGAAARDNTFDGYVANDEGLPTGKWAVAGRSNVRLDHGSGLAAACGTDTANDTVIYIKFNQGASVDTGVTPDITGTNDTLAANSDGLTKLFSNTGNWTTTDVTETDKAGAYIFLATAASGGAAAGLDAGDTLTLRFSERTNAPGSLTASSLDDYFELSGGGLFGVSTNITSANWSTTTFTNDTLTITFAAASGTPVAVGQTIKLKPQATLADNATNQAAAVATVTTPPTIGGTFTPGQAGPVISSATYLDTDADGYIDTVRVVFGTTVQDSSFPGHAGHNALGTVTSQWSVSGYNNVRIVTGTAVGGSISDTQNDNTIYLRFAEGSTYDTGVKPDLTATDQSLYGPAGGTVSALPSATACYVNTSVGAGNCATQTASDVLTANVVEADGANPIIVKATAKSGVASVFISFSENVASDAAFSACGSGGQMVAADFTYVDGNSASPNGFNAFSSSDTCATGDAFIEGTANGTYNTGDLNIDKVQAATATSIYDAAGNAMSTARQQVIAEATAPYVIAASTYRTDLGGGVYKYYARVFFSEPVSNAAASNAYSALRTANYTVAEDPADAGCTDFSTTPAGATAVGGSNRVIDLETGAQCSTTTYKITAATTIKDIDEFENITTPNFAFAKGTAATDVTAPRLLLARSLSATTVELTYSEPMLTGTGANSAECATAAVCATEDADGTAGGSQSKYWLTPSGLGNVTSVASTADKSVYVLTHTTAQQGNFYTINAYATSTGNRIPRDLNANNLETAPGNQAVFQGAGTPILSFSDGAVFSDPFSDGTKFNFAFSYQNKIYLGPNDKNNAAFRFEADGLNPVGITFSITGGATCNPATSFGISGGTCGAQTIGPNNERGIVGFNAGTYDNGTTQVPVLMAGVVKDNVDKMYFTQDVDTQLDWKTCAGTFTGTNGVNSKSVQSLYIFGTNIYAGIASAHNTNAPILNKIALTESGGVISCTGSFTDLAGNQIVNMGKGTGGNNPAPNGTTIGIDAQMYVPTGGGPTPVNTYYLFNNGGVAASTGAPTSNTSFSSVKTQASFGGTTLTYPAATGLEKVRPGQKGMPLVVVWNGALYAARNLAAGTSAANSEVNAGAELWKCTATCTASANWYKVLSTTDTNNTFANRANLRAISLLQVNGNFLYIGFDNPTNGAQIYRSQSGITQIDGTTACTGGDGTANNGDGYRCFEQQGTAGFGAPADNQFFFSSSSLRKGSQNFIYVTVGDQNLVAIKVLRQVD